MTSSVTSEDKSLLQFYRTLLLNKKAELLLALGSNSHEMANGVEEGRADLGQLSQAESVSVLLNLALYGQLREVGEALERLDREEYGLCLDCGRPIGPKRLEAVPWTRYCLSCQEKANSSEPFVRDDSMGRKIA